jgi:hypothetical protein
MLTEQQLNDLIEAWPDENGVSKNPETYEAWKQTEKAIALRVIVRALGRARIDNLTDKQTRLLERAYGRLFERKHISEVTYLEILGQYEIVTEHMSPSWQEAAVRRHKTRN